MKEKACVFYREHKDIVIHGIVFLTVGIVYYLVVLLTPFGIPCPIHLVTGLSCPGCGVSRFFMELGKLNFIMAARQNLAVAILLPLWLIVGAVEFFFNPKALAKGSKLVNILTWGSVVILVVFGILRNIPGFEWLLPTA